MSDDDKLIFTGERFTPECVREIWYEHYHRYAFAKNFVNDKKVLDAACGEGYGSHILSKYSKHVTGIDIDKESISHANRKYDENNLSFIVASCSNLPFENNSFDVVVSFETLEHLAEQEQMLAEFNRVLKNDGTLIISTPDKKYYSDEAEFHNEFHVKELYKEEFKNLLDSYWQHQNWYSQAMNFSSILEKQNTTNKEFTSDILNNQEFEINQTLLKPMYYVVVASNIKNKKLKLPALHLFSDKEQSVYEHYNKTIKDFIYLANKHNELIKKVDKWLSIPILGKIIKILDKRK
ncbi:MAG: class I SAM-dependent methyltransferase [Marinicellaceae bacterium]